MPQSREGETQKRGLRTGSERHCAVIQRPGLRSLWPSYAECRGAASPRSSGAGPVRLAGDKASERTGHGERLAALLGSLGQAALAFATWVAIASISAGDRQS